MAQDLRSSSLSRKDRQDLDDLFYPIPLYGELLMALLFTLSIIQEEKLTPVNGKTAGISTFTKFASKNKKRISKVLIDLPPH
jgi:hypothetical protein